MSDLSHIEITEQEIDEALERPSSFGYHGDRPMFITWSLGPVIETRDSGLIAQSNAASWKAIMEEAEGNGTIEKDSWEVISCNHWGPGWVDHLSFQAIKDEESREPTNAFRLVMETVAALQEYPILDDSDHSQREYDAALESIQQNAPSVVENVPEDWPQKVFSAIWEMDGEKQEHLCDSDEGVYVPEELIAEALQELGWRACTECYGSGFIKTPPFCYAGPTHRVPFAQWIKVTCEDCDGDGKYRKADNE
jgi:hypothetical protein